MTIDSDWLDNQQVKLEQISPNHALPIITIPLTRPKITGRLLVLGVVMLGWLRVFIGGFGLMIINLQISGRDLAILMFIFVFLMIILRLEIKNYHIKAFWDTSKDNCYCKLSPTHLQIVYNDKIESMTWQQIYGIDYRWWSQQYQSHVIIDLNWGNYIRLYRSNLPVSCKQLAQFIKLYRQKALLRIPK